MSWVSELYETYEKCSDLVGIPDDAGIILLPIAHSTQNAQIEAAIDEEGKFQWAKILEKDEAVTIIPVTEDSGSRGNGNNPHPLHDKLVYVAGDYAVYDEKSNIAEYFEHYITYLESWCNSQEAHHTVAPIFRYLKKKELIQDLLKEGVLVLKDGTLSDEVKIQNIPQNEVFIRFRVVSLEKNIELPWKDKTLYNSFINFYTGSQNTKDLCYISGEIIPCSDKHPSKIRYSGDKAKLFSANDNTGFTYRGRFKDRSQAVSVGYRTSQMVHNALRWLLEKQGYRRDDMAVAAWSTEGVKIPGILANPSDELFSNGEELPRISSPGEAYGNMVKKAMKGYESNLKEKSKIVVISLDTATTGRLSVTYYKELMGSEFYKNLQYWYVSCSWEILYKSKTDKTVRMVGTPSPKDIVEAAYGVEQSGNLVVKTELIKATMKRLLPCIIDRTEIPADIVQSAYHKVLVPMSMSHYSWDKCIGITCALIRKRKLKEEWSMDVYGNPESPEYLCGRLLAVMDALEQWALDKAEEVRPTNAIKYFNQFAQNPNKTYAIIRKNLNPYIIRLGVKNCRWMTDIWESISESLSEEKLVQLKNLDGRFILGFDCQRKAIRDEKERRKAAREAKQQKGVSEEEE